LAYTVFSAENMDSLGQEPCSPGECHGVSRRTTTKLRRQFTTISSGITYHTSAACCEAFIYWQWPPIVIYIPRILCVHVHACRWILTCNARYFLPWTSALVRASLPPPTISPRTPLNANGLGKNRQFLEFCWQYRVTVEQLFFTVGLQAVGLSVWTWTYRRCWVITALQ